VQANRRIARNTRPGPHKAGEKYIGAVGSRQPNNVIPQAPELKSRAALSATFSDLSCRSGPRRVIARLIRPIFVLNIVDYIHVAAQGV
jgi:hypothetical protein